MSGPQPRSAFNERRPTWAAPNRGTETLTVRGERVMLKNAILVAVVACLTGLLPLVGGNGTATAADAKTDWPTYTSAEGKYKVSMPDKPQVTTQDLGVG